jgi:hypothetical protein
MKTPGRFPDLQPRSTPRPLRAVAIAAVLIVAAFVASALHGEVVSTPHVRVEILRPAILGECIL